ncbi:hypothetical protein KGF56_000531 [Candida oxycetoniae]|uniref:Nodulin-like domain-containing protein n=1 Tax=Candida oxycetoniae TaxID=497107 RepID=A0AAI9X086_9ASCO|nr:uncharacterized protein KGF56_000531 [Candida oxycetoniae]KAI3406685.2 hypothetical protein KGF56_000531 [Candida oxycetoniae]
MPSSKSTLTSQEGKKFIKDYMKSQYRPFSANDIQLNLHNQVTKTKLVQILQELVVEKELIVKSVGKTNYYCYKELKVSFDSCIDIEQEISIETYLKELNKDIGVLNSVSVTVSAAPLDSVGRPLCGTVGVAVAGPVSGVVVDKKGYTISILIGGILIITGYIGMKYQLDQVWNNLLLSCYWIFSIGLGSTFINSACLKCCAVGFPSIRGVATSLPLALYGLSALFYSVIASTFYPGKTSEFLEFLARSIVIIFVVCVPSVYIADRDHKLKAASNFHGKKSIGNEAGVMMMNQKENFLFTSYKFWLLFVITGILAALGQMYIYSVGYIVKALVGYSLSKVDVNDKSMEFLNRVDLLVQQEQQLHVGLISIANCLGRISSGILGDIITQSFGKPRSWLLVIPALGTTISQILCGSIQHYSKLQLNSFLIGFFYGFVFCIMPIIVGDTFGMENFSFNWGMVSLAPIIPSYYFTSLFGEVYDANSNLIPDELGKDMQIEPVPTSVLMTGCNLGYKCYSSVFRLTSIVGFVALTLVIALIAAGLIFKKRSQLLSLSEIRADEFNTEKRQVRPS